MHLSKEQQQNNYDAGRGRSSSAFRDGDRDQRGAGGGGWSTPFRGRGGMAHSMEQEKDAILSATRSFTGRRTPTGSRNASRESSRNRQSQVSREPEQGPIKKELSEELMEKKSRSILEEYLNVGDLDVCRNKSYWHSLELGGCPLLLFNHCDCYRML